MGHRLPVSSWWTNQFYSTYKTLSSHTAGALFLKNFPEPVKTHKNPTCHAERSISLVEHLLFEILRPASGGRTDKVSVTNKR